MSPSAAASIATSIATSIAALIGAAMIAGWIVSCGPANIISDPPRKPPPTEPSNRIPEGAALLTLDVDPPNPTVWINGQLQGPLSRWSDRTLPLPEGRHRLELRHDGYYPHRADLTLQPNQPMTLRVRMVERLD